MVGHLDLIAPHSKDILNTKDGHRLNGDAHLSDTDISLVPEGLGFHETLEKVEKQLIHRTLDQQHWHRTNTAEALGIPRKTLFRKMKKYGLA